MLSCKNLTAEDEQYLVDEWKEIQEACPECKTPCDCHESAVVPTSIGYGTSLKGLTALFAMLNSCVPGIAVMNIDNGFGAGCLAHKINMV